MLAPTRADAPPFGVPPKMTASATPRLWPDTDDETAVGAVVLYVRENRKGARWRKVAVYESLTDAVAAMVGMPGSADFWFGTKPEAIED
jgi:hypothetical protein